jgi:hypothetical protein
MSILSVREGNERGKYVRYLSRQEIKIDRVQRLKEVEVRTAQFTSNAIYSSKGTPYRP